MKKLPKVFSTSAVALAALSLVTACGTSNGTGSGNGSGSSGGSGSTPTTIRIAVVSGGEADALKALAPEYEKAHNVKINFVSFSYDTLFTKELQSVTSSQGSYDLIFMDDPWMATFAGGGYLAPLSQFNYTPDGFIPGAIQVDKWPPVQGYPVPKGTNTNDGYYALPVTSNVTLFAYRTDLAKKYGINPGKWTWDDVNQLANKAKADGTAGFVLRSGSGNSAVTDLFPLISEEGGQYFDDNWNTTVNSKSFVDALTEWVHLFKLGPSGEASFGSDDVGNYLDQGKAAAGIIWPSGWASNLPSNIGLAEVPGVKQPDGSIKQIPEIGVWSMGVAKNSPNAKAAFDFLKWLTDDAQQKEYGAQGVDVPTRTNVILDSSLDQKFSWYKTVYDSLNDGHMRPRTPAWPQVEQDMGNEVVKAEQGQETPVQAVQNASTQISEYMKQHGLTK